MGDIPKWHISTDQQVVLEKTIMNLASAYRCLSVFQGPAKVSLFCPIESQRNDALSALRNVRVT
jgi:hypothetical protein